MPIMIKGVTGITVCYDTKSSMKRAYESVRRFCLDIPIIIIDGSDSGNPCACYVKSLASDLTTVISLGKNIGHGRGMHMGISQVKTKYALMFDSDIEMLKACLAAMLEMMEDDTFGVGHICKTGFDGYDCGKKPRHRKEGCMVYLHPFFQLVNINNYKKFHRYVHHGAPCYLTMFDIHRQGLSDKILKEFPNLKEYVKHYGRVTRNYRSSKRLRPIADDWEYS